MSLRGNKSPVSLTRYRLVVLAMLFAGLAMMGIKRRRARMQQQNLAYVHNPVQNNQGYYYNGAAAPGYYPPPNGPGGPQYPPQSYTPYQGPGGYDPTAGFAPVSFTNNVPRYSGV